MKRFAAITREHTLWCDHCTEWVQLCGFDTKAKFATHMEKQKKWKFEGGKWSCPECQKKGAKS